MHKADWKANAREEFTRCVKSQEGKTQVYTWVCDNDRYAIGTVSKYISRIYIPKNIDADYVVTLVIIRLESEHWNILRGVTRRREMLLFMIGPVLFGPLAAETGRWAGGARGGGLGDVQVRLLAPRAQQLQRERGRGRPAGRWRSGGGAHADTDTSTARTHASDWISRAATAIGASTDAAARSAPARPEKSDLAPLTLSIQAERITTRFLSTLYL